LNQDGIKLFTYSFYKQRRADVQVLLRHASPPTSSCKLALIIPSPLIIPSQAFFAQIYSEAQGSQAAPGHHALASMSALGRVRRHYTLNIDGLAEAVGISTWHHAHNPEGVTVEMHGNIRLAPCS
jgi:hypothetical protein